MGEALPPPPERDPDVEDDFGGDQLSALWVDHYLPHWTTPERSAARGHAGEDGWHLRIDEDQPDWRPEDAPLRVSNLQTGTFSGPLDSHTGTHRHRDDGLVVRTPTPTRLLWAPSAGRVEVAVSASTDPGCMLAVWLVGTEHLDPAQAGEICVFEIDAEGVGTGASVARSGIKAHHDPQLVTDMEEVTVPLDASRPHTWTAIWDGDQTLIGCEGEVVRRIPQAPDYPMFLMVDLFEIGPPVGHYPKSATVHHFRGWSSRPGYSTGPTGLSPRREGRRGRSR